MLTICTHHTGDAPNNERQLYTEIKEKIDKLPLKVWRMIFSQKRMQVSLRRVSSC